MPVARFKKVCLDAVDPDRLGRFWASTLELTWTPWPHGEGGVFGAGPNPVIWVNRVPEPKAVRHRVRLHVHTAGRPGQADLTDPEGGEYRVHRRPDPPADRLFAVVVDSADPSAQACWWAKVFGAVAVDDPVGSAGVRGVPGMPFERIDFVAAREPKTVKNRIHWDLAVADPHELVAAGARVLRAPGGDVDWFVLADPEGNEFCAFVG